jgi:HAD superfamily hydrolase (TIGR01509 family)
VLFDFDGVIVDTEPLHLAAFRRALEPEGIRLSDAHYYDTYLGYDDHDAIVAALREIGRVPDREVVRVLMARKAAHFLELVHAGVRLFPGVPEFVTEAGARGPLAIGSGALRDEIELILERVGLRDAFAAIVSADDVQHGKPDPETYRRALAALVTTSPGLAAHECLVIEDSVAGVRAAKAAGMRCLAVTNSCPRAALEAEADLVVDSLAEAGWDGLDAAP